MELRCLDRSDWSAVTLCPRRYALCTTRNPHSATRDQKLVVNQLLKRLYHILQEAVFPPKCLVCDTFFQIADKNCKGISVNRPADGQARYLSFHTRAEISLAGCLCSRCLAALIPVESPLCNCCGIPFASRQGEDHFCGACLASGNQFGIARASLVYNEITTELIHSFKYRGKIQLADPLGELLLTAFMFFWDIETVDFVLPVPLHPGRLRQRGFNQAYLMIRNWPHLAARRGNDLPSIRIERDLLIRTRPTAPQTALGRSQRAENIKNAFDLSRQEAVHGKNIVLIDDVYTTGATVNECGRLLIKHGAQNVDVLTLARAI